MKINFSILIPFVVFALLLSCAHPGNPGGGPKDRVAPVVLTSFPENGSANFNTNKFIIDFNEFIQLEDIHNQALISPPLYKKPDFRVKGRSLQVNFNEELKANTTYSVYFGDAITDITEGNPVSNYTYLFSTGNFVDSLSLQGKVKDAFTLEPIEGCFVMLYKDDNDTISLDSLPLYVRPYYLSKTDKEGRFRFNGLGNMKYLMFAILDMNSSLSFDQPNEQIAFIDSLIQPTYVNKPKKDTSLIDSLANMVTELDKNIASDSLSELIADSLQKAKRNPFSDQLITYEMFLYNEKDSLLKLMSAKIVKDNTIEYAFNIPINNDVSIAAVNHADREIWYVSDTSENADTITWFYKNLPFDTLEVLVKHKTDTLDFINFRLNKPKVGKRKKKEEPKNLKWTTSPVSRVLKPGNMPGLVFSQPIEAIDFDSVVLISGSDTILKPEFYFTDSLQMQIEIPVKNIENTNYLLVIPDSCIFDWNGLSNKESLVKFSTKPLSEYGTFILNVSLKSKESIILQLLNSKNNVLKQDLFSTDTVLVYNYLNPGKYKLKVIFDSNNNGKWDMGSYLKNIQAEKVIYYKTELEVRANWDVEEEWVIGDPSALRASPRKGDLLKVLE